MNIEDVHDKESLLMYIKEYEDCIFVRAQVEGKWINSSLADLPQHIKEEHIRRFVENDVVPVRVLRKKEQEEWPNLILEGCDGVGKTTIATVLTRCTVKFHTSLKRNAPKNKDEGKRKNEEDVQILNNNHGVVYDRGIFGERVYAPIFRNYYPEYMDELEEQLLPHNWLVLIVARTDQLEKRYDGEFIKKSQIPEIQESYAVEFEKCKIKNKIIVANVGSIFDTVNEILSKVGVKEISRHHFKEIFPDGAV